MPTYDYRCEKCGHEFEAFHSITAKPLRKCPKCGKQALQRLIGTGAALLFKGEGFYITDYRSENYKNAAKADSGSPAGEGKPADAKTGDSKPVETKADSKPAESKTAPATTPAAAPKPPPKPERASRGSAKKNSR